jgi:hypothetical protein
MPAACRLVLYVIDGEIVFGAACETPKAVAPEDGYPRGLTRPSREDLMSAAAADELGDERPVVSPCSRIGVVLVGIIRYFMASAGAPWEPFVAGVCVLVTHCASLGVPQGLGAGHHGPGAVRGAVIPRFHVARLEDGTKIGPRSVLEQYHDQA